MALVASSVQPAELTSLKRTHSSENSDDCLYTSLKILNIIYKYRLTKSPFTSNNANDRWAEGTPKFLQTIQKYVRTREMLKMCLPAFPFKSCNKKFKVLGALPDKAEEVALTRLNDMCLEIGEIYTPGARLLIISDGLVYNDLLTVPDREVWNYGQALRCMAAKSCPRISFSRLKDLVNLPDLPSELEEITYVASASNFRRALLNQFGNDTIDVRREIAEKEDTRLTYCGYKRFLESDLQEIFPRGNERSNSNVVSSQAFAAAVQQNFPDHLRLSIHQSTGANKISVSLLPTDTSYTTPWQCCIAERSDGSVTSGPRGEFEADAKYEVIRIDGRPALFREKV
ncbi:MAG: hypothetical protein Q9160_006415 [Pyrenula sp. 1 TL-2023]